MTRTRFGVVIVVEEVQLSLMRPPLMMMISAVALALPRS